MVALIDLLPLKLWNFSGIGPHRVRAHATAVAAANAELSYNIPRRWRLTGRSASGAVPVPVVELSPTALAQWSAMVAAAHPAGNAALLVESGAPRGEAGPPSRDPDGQSSLMNFLHTASPEALRLAVLAATSDSTTLAVLRAIQQELLPESAVSDLAEVLVSGIFQRVPDSNGPDLRVRMNADCRAGLQALASPQDRWDVYRAVSVAIERASPESAGSFQAAVHDLRGNITVREDQQAFAEIARSALAQAADTRANLVPDLPADPHTWTLAQRKDAAIAIADELDRAQALVDLAPDLPADLLRSASAAAIAITDGRALARALAGLAPYLSSDQLAQALDAATGIADELDRAQALASLVPHLPADLRSQTLAKALDAASAIADEQDRAQALADLAPYLPPGQLVQALDAGTGITDDFGRAQALASPDVGWRVFVSHTSELRDFPAGGSYIAEVERAISAAGHVIVTMADFPADDQVPAELCRERVRGCQAYVGVLGTRYGAPVRDQPEVSYTELEFGTATEAGLPRLMFLLDTDASEVGIPPVKLIDWEFGPRQDAFRRRVQDSGLVTRTFADPATLGQQVERSLRELVGTRRHGGGGQDGQASATVGLGEIPREPPWFPGVGWRVFVSHTSELKEFPAGRSYVAAAERAISAAGHVIVDMADFPAAGQPPAQLCIDRVQGCQLYVGVLGTRYGSPVRDRPQVSYTELEFDAAAEAGLPRLVFLLDTEAADVGIPLSGLIDLEFGPRQQAFLRRVKDSGLVTMSFANPEALGRLVERSLRALAETRRPGGGGPRGQLPAVVVAGEIPQQPLGFQPRADLLAALFAPSAGSRVPVVRALTGMRGVGKTHLAAAYARAKLAEGWRLVAWVNAEVLVGVLAGLAEVAAVLGLDTSDAEAAGRAVRHWLEVDGERCLLVFDNATDPELLRPFIPAAGAAQVIITSNRQSVAYLGSGMPVDVFTEQEALTFLATRTGQADTAGALVLAAELGFLPLALAQAAAVIAGQHLSYKAYLDRLRVLPAGDLLTPEEAGQYPQGVAAAVLLSLDGVRTGEQGQACGAVMDLLAVLSAAGVRRSLVHVAAREGLPGRDGSLPALAPDVADRVLARLAGASLLTFSVDGSSVSANRLVLRVLQENLAAGNLLTAVCEAAARLLDGLAGSLNGSWYEDRAAVRDLVEQITALYESSARCPADSDLDDRMIRLRSWAVAFLNHLADSPMQAILIGERLVADQEQGWGPDHPGTLASRSNLAEAYQDAGRTAEAIALHEQTLAARERVLGPDLPDTLASRSNLATAYQDAGRTAEAIALHEQTLAARERVLGPDHPDTLASRSNLATAYQDAGRTAEAIALHEQTLADDERILGPDHPETLQSRANLATAYRAAGRTGEAVALHEQTLAARERVLGPDHPDTLASRSNLATAYQDAGRTAEAIALHEQTLAARERVLGPDHPDTLASRSNLATAYQDAGRTAEAIALHEQTLAARERVLGPDHPDTLASRSNLATAYQDTGRTAETTSVNPQPSDP